MANKKVPPVRPGFRANSPDFIPGKTLRLRVSSAAESILRSGHPWLFAESIRSQNHSGEAGQLGVVYDRNDRFLAVGLWDPESAIRLRVLQANKPQVIDRGFWGIKLDQALRLRAGLFDERTTGFRWINGESDGWPGLVLDRYGNTLVMKLYTVAWLPWLGEVIEIINDQLRPERIVLRLSRNAQKFAQEKFGRTDGQIVNGAPVGAAVQFVETGLHFEAEILRGQKTGFFLDQRENRRRVELLARGRAVLNAFSFSGGFSLYAARGGARAVADLDISAHALAASKRNFNLNKSDAAISNCVKEQIQADAFEWLETSKRRFDLIVLDPPSLAKKETERGGALVAYNRLASLAISRLSAGGFLVACSCSAHVSASEFFQAVHAAASKAASGFVEIERTGHPPDHPAAFPEANYLKAIYLKVR
jgi:23S rRNA (cytosine1962-C5)-methyltransferase